MLSGVTVSCFGICYLLVLALELTRWWFRVPYRMVAVIGLTVLGLFTHFLYLQDLVVRQLAESGPAALFASWHDWTMISAFALTAIYLMLVLLKPKSPVGTFLLPLVIALVASGITLRNARPFERDTAMGLWRWMHGGSLMIGTTLVTLGFAVALMYLFQSRRLKSKTIAGSRPTLPSLEYLQLAGSYCLYVSSFFVGCGLTAGVIMNLQRSGHISWTDRGIVFSGVLFLWLGVSSILEFRLARRSLWTWTAYINIGSFVCLALTLIFVVFSQHGRSTGSFLETPNSQEQVGFSEEVP